MKEHMLSVGKWLVVGGLLLVVGVFVAFGLGRTRGTRSYRWRVSLWTALVGLMAGGALLVSGCPRSEPSADPADATGDKTGLRGPAKTYEGSTHPPCYGDENYDWSPQPPPPQKDVKEGPNPWQVPEVCYGHEEYDWQPQPPPPPPPKDTIEACYGHGDFDEWSPPPAPDIVEKKDAQFPLEDAIIMCYDPMPEDVAVEKDTKETSEPPPPPEVCYGHDDEWW